MAANPTEGLRLDSSSDHLPPSRDQDTKGNQLIDEVAKQRLQHEHLVLSCNETHTSKLQGIVRIIQAEVNRGRPLKALESAEEVEILSDFTDVLLSIATDTYQLAPDSPLQHGVVQMHKSPVGSEIHFNLPRHRFLIMEPDV